MKKKMDKKWNSCSCYFYGNGTLPAAKIQIRDREAASQFSLKVHRIRPVRLKTQRKILLS